MTTIEWGAMPDSCLRAIASWPVHSKGEAPWSHHAEHHGQGGKAAE